MWTLEGNKMYEVGFFNRIKINLIFLGVTHQGGRAKYRFLGANHGYLLAEPNHITSVAEANLGQGREITEDFNP